MTQDHASDAMAYALGAFKPIGEPEKARREMLWRDALARKADETIDRYIAECVAQRMANKLRDDQLASKVAQAENLRLHLPPRAGVGYDP